MSMHNMTDKTNRSIYGLEFAYDTIPNKLVPFDYDTFEKTGCRLTVVCTDCETGKPFYYQGPNERTITDYLRASSSIPLVSPMVELDGRKFVDGGVGDSIPLQRMLDEGFIKNVVVLTRNLGYQKKRSHTGFVAKMKYHNYPNLVDAIENRYQNYNESLALCEAQEREGAALVLRPSKPVELDRFEKDREKLLALYQNGYEDAENMIDTIRQFCDGAENVNLSLNRA